MREGYDTYGSWRRMAFTVASGTILKRMAGAMDPSEMRA